MSTVEAIELEAPQIQVSPCPPPQKKDTTVYCELGPVFNIQEKIAVHFHTQYMHYAHVYTCTCVYTHKGQTQ